MVNGSNSKQQSSKADTKFVAWSASKDLDSFVWAGCLNTLPGIDIKEPGKGLGFLDNILCAEDAKAVKKAIRQTSSTEVPSCVRAMTLNNSACSCLEFSTWLQPIDNNTAARLFGTITDVSTDEQRKINLVHVEELMVDTQSLASLFYWEYDALSREMEVSHAGYGLLGLEPESGLNDDIFDPLLHPDDYDAFMAMRNKIVTEGMPEGYDFRCIIHGKTKYMRMFSSPFLDEQGTVYKILGVTQDITELKQTQANLEILNHELEERVSKRTKQLREAQDELIQSEKMATLGKLTATVSHELRNPLGAMFVALDFLQVRLQNLGEKETKAFQRLKRSAARCDHIIDELLDFTRVKSGNTRSLHVEQFLSTYLHEYTLPEGVDLRIDFNCPDATIVTDEASLCRILNNTFDNACQAMLDAGADMHLTVATSQEEKNCRISVIDTGPGIANGDKKKIFEPLYTTKTFGVGLGLAIVKQLVEQLDGKISVESQTGKGTTFSFLFPTENNPAVSNKSRTARCEVVPFTWTT